MDEADTQSPSLCLTAPNQGGQMTPRKWWHWYRYVGRWMPSEPPDGEVVDAYWCVSDTPPAVPGPDLDADDDQQSWASEAPPSS